MANTAIQDYITLCKPRVVVLMLITAVASMLLAVPPDHIPWETIALGTVAIGLAASAGGALNQLIDRNIDAVMTRTQDRPVAAGRISVSHALWFIGLLITLSMMLFVRYLNITAAILSFSTLIGYGIIYTVFLKRATPQNIVIGGLAGAMPPLLGWSVISGRIDAAPLLLVLIIFVWTPPHFWALAISRQEEYAKADIPMLPVTHGVAFTQLNILLYTILLSVVTYLPFAIDASGWIYAASVTVLNIGFLRLAVRLYCSANKKLAYRTFHYSIHYLGLLFAALLIDHFIFIG